MAADGDLTAEHEEHLKGASIVLYTGRYVENRCEVCHLTNRIRWYRYGMTGSPAYTHAYSLWATD